MSSKFEPLIPATLAFDDRGIPQSLHYEDVYYPDSGALGQATHVFLRGNQLPERWRGKQQFTVCETGFGLGHNFLVLWHAWRCDPRRSQRLHLLSFEAHPFSREDLAVMFGRLPGPLYKELASHLLASWPPLVPGIHRLEFEGGAVTLTLVFGSIRRMARQVCAGVDAFFLDGFSPRFNPEMWSRSLFGQLVRIANAGATVASWCSAGDVRHDLRDAGFLVSKVPGFASKREMTVAVLRPGMGRQAVRATGTDTVLIVGGGLAGAGMAHSLALRGHDVTVLDPVFAQGPGASHKGHLAAAMTPVLSRDDDVRSRLSRAGIRRALQRWSGLAGNARPLRCTTLNLSLDSHHAVETQKTLAHLKFPRNWAKWLSKDEASDLVGRILPSGGVWLADGSLVQPEALLSALFSHSAVQCIAQSVGHLELSSSGQWIATSVDGKILALASTVVLANAAHAATLLGRVQGSPRLPKLNAMARLGGQVSYFRQDTAPASQLVIAGDGYWLPAVNGYCVGGSTYEADILDTEVSAMGHLEICQKVGHLLGIQTSLLGASLDREVGWAGWRATAPDRLPVIGPVGVLPGLWLACGYGSRGLSWSALAGDIVAATLGQEPVPLERELLRSIAPR